MGRFTDVDLILVKETDRPFNERPPEFDDLYDLGPELDLLVYTPAEFDTMMQNPSTGFWSRVATEKIRIL
jgi:hypothetical protein